MSEDDKRRAFERYLAWLIANRRKLPMAPYPELGEELPSREIRAPIGLTRSRKSKLPM